MSLQPEAKKFKRASFFIFLLVFLVVVFFILGTKFKGLVVVATVNGKPIYSWELAKHFWEKYSQKALSDLIEEEILNQEAVKNQVTVSSQEIRKEIQKITDNIGGQRALNDYLGQERLSWSDFQKEVARRLKIQKIIEKGIVIKDKEIEIFIERFRYQMEATQGAGLKQEAREILKSQKILEEYNSFFDKLKKEVEIQQFLLF